MPSSICDVGPLGDEQRVVARLGKLGEEVPHLAGRLEVVLGPLEVEAVGVRQQRTRLHAEQRVVGHRVFSMRVVAVVGGQQRGIEPAGDLHQLRVGPLLIGDPVVLQFDEEVLLAENVLQPSGPALRQLDVAAQQRLEHHATQAPRGGDQALVVSLEQLPVESGLVVVPLQVGGRGELEQIAVPLDRLRQEGQVVVELLPPFHVAAGVVHLAPPDRPLVARLGRHVGLGADDRRDALLTAGLVEVEDPVHVPVVGDPEGRLSVGGGRGHQRRRRGRHRRAWRTRCGYVGA